MAGRNEKLRDKALAALPTWHFDKDEEVYLDTPAIKLFSPLSGSAYWYLVQKDDSDSRYVRYFGLCELIPGGVELGWVAHQDLISKTAYDMSIVELDEYWEGTLGDGNDHLDGNLTSFMTNCPVDDPAEGKVCTAMLCGRDADTWWGGSPMCHEHHDVMVSLAREAI